MIKNFPELFRRPERRCFSIFEADLDPGRTDTAKKDLAVKQHIDRTLDTFIAYAKKHDTVYGVIDFRKHGSSLIIFKFNDISFKLQGNSTDGCINVIAMPEVFTNFDYKENTLEYCAAKNDPLDAGLFLYKSAACEVLYCVTLSCEERALTAKELEWMFTAAYRKLSSCMGDLTDIAHGHVPRSVIHREADKAADCATVHRYPSAWRTKRAENMLRSFRKNLPEEYILAKSARKGKRGELFSSALSLNNEVYVETVYADEEKITVVCTSNRAAVGNNRAEVLRYLLEMSDSEDKYELKFDDNGKLCICLHLPLVSSVPSEECFRKIISLFHFYVSIFMPRFNLFIEDTDDDCDDDIPDECDDDDDILLNSDDIDFADEIIRKLLDINDPFDDVDPEAPFGSGIFDDDPDRYHVKIDEGEKSYAHPPLHLTDDEM